MELKQAYPSVVFSTPDLKNGRTYAVYSGDQKVVSFTVESQVTWLNESGVTTAPRAVARTQQSPQEGNSPLPA